MAAIAITDKTVVYILAVAVILAIVGLTYQHFEIRSLRSQMQDNQATLESVSHDAASTLAKLESQESRLEVLESTARESAMYPGFPSVEKLDALQAGYYQLTTSTPYDPDIEAVSSYTIAHVVVELNYKTSTAKVNVGMARSGLTPSTVYFDYDNDGRIDVDMAFNFVRDIPVVGRSLARAYDPVVAQNLYSVFVNEVENAEYTSVDDLANDAEAASSYLWRFVNSHYSAIEAWVVENLPDQQKQE